MQEHFSDLPTLAHLIGAARCRIKQALWAQLHPLGLTPQQFWVLLVADVGENLSLHELAQQVWMDDPTASRVVKALIARQLLSSAADPHHGRRRVIQLGPEGKRLQPTLRTLAAAFRTQVERGVTPETEARLRRDLNRIITNMNELDGRSLLPNSPTN